MAKLPQQRRIELLKYQNQVLNPYCKYETLNLLRS